MVGLKTGQHSFSFLSPATDWQALCGRASAPDDRVGTGIGLSNQDHGASPEAPLPPRGMGRCATSHTSSVWNEIQPARAEVPADQPHGGVGEGGLSDEVESPPGERRADSIPVPHPRTTMKPRQQKKISGFCVRFLAGVSLIRVVRCQTPSHTTRQNVVFYPSGALSC